MIDGGLEKFAEDFRQEIINLADAEDLEQFRGDQFTELMIEHLSDAGEIDDGNVCSHAARGIKVNGYSVSEDEDCLDLFTSICTLEVPPVSVTGTQIQTALKRVMTFVDKSFKEYYKDLEEASMVFDMAQRVYELRKQLTRIRIFVLTDGLTSVESIPNQDFNGIQVTHHIWDVRRLYRCLSSGRKRETIEIDFHKRFGYSIPCLRMPNDNDIYTSYMAIMPGQVLVDIYADYGPRLLERNVRCFLQARSKVNKAIRSTIRNEPHMFLAYNNGISATAESVALVKKHEDGHLYLGNVMDLQIVNGGQTTASLYHTFKKDKASVEDCYVQMKLTVIANDEQIDIMVPKISEYANTQNKVTSADFSANSPFHIKIEELSRTTWVPATDGQQRQTRWYYERARGQYLDEKSREPTPAKKKAFAAMNPTNQKFKKIELAKYENTWDQLPHLVCLGAQKNFQKFTVRLKDRGGSFMPDLTYFQNLVAKAILFRTTEKLVSSQPWYGGYRANIVAYTLALLSHRTAQRIDLEKIWKEQKLSSVLEQAIGKVAEQAWKHLSRPPGSGTQNIGEWSKKENCWDKFKGTQIDLPAGLEDELIDLKYVKKHKKPPGIEQPDEREKELIQKVAKVPAETWFRISKWAKETNNLMPWQRGLAFSLGQLAGRKREPSRKQATQGFKILKEAAKLGFDMSEVNISELKH